MRRAFLLTAVACAHGLVALPAFADDERAPAPTTISAPSASTKVDWFARFDLGLRSVTSSPEQDLLDADGYGATPRFVIAGEFARMVSPVVGVSGWVDYSLRTSQVDSSPTLKEDVLMVGAGLPLVPVGWQGTVLMMVPRVGYGWSWMSIGRSVPAVGAPVYGADLIFAWPRAHVNVAFGWLNGSTRPPGDIGRRSNFGGIGLSVGAVIDG
jgi:hypothetical protein